MRNSAIDVIKLEDAGKKSSLNSHLKRKDILLHMHSPAYNMALCRYAVDGSVTARLTARRDMETTRMYDENRRLPNTRGREGSETII